eukprot:1197015-Rhodomonas_salina.2
MPTTLQRCSSTLAPPPKPLLKFRKSALKEREGCSEQAGGTALREMQSRWQARPPPPQACCQDGLIASEAELNSVLGPRLSPRGGSNVGLEFPESGRAQRKGKMPARGEGKGWWARHTSPGVSEREDTDEEHARRGGVGNAGGRSSVEEH